MRTAPTLSPRPRTATPPAAPVRPTPAPTPARPVVAPAPEPVQPGIPTWSHRFLPRTLRTLLADLGCWNNPAPQLPSTHLDQTLAVLQHYGWCRSQDVTPTGRMCIRGAQNLLEKTGHVTSAGRERAVAYMHQILANAGIRMEFFTWNDLPDQQFPAVQTLLEDAAHLARKNGE
ncbi:DUF6197 family protein [Streptomyces kaempferi]|uniref:Uncharacterized protein n=1 Tax=Streptomyces kaempferi TaxID=333725 RepID=A0ABW3XHL0_9ACTN